MKSYVFRVVLEKDEDVWRAFIPGLESKGAATWAMTKEEALTNMREVAQIVIESMLEDGESLPPRIAEIDQPGDSRRLMLQTVEKVPEFRSLRFHIRA
jgi:predicted RNase H-like HicB family nuclease